MLKAQLNAKFELFYVQKRQTRYSKYGVNIRGKQKVCVWKLTASNLGTKTKYNFL